MSKLPTLSLIVPVYNEAEQLPGCLDALLAQASEIFEIIIVDNNSSDDSLAIVKKYARQSTLIRVLRENQQGLVPTRNRGFMAAKSDVIARIDADTKVLPGWALAIRQCFTSDDEIQALDGTTSYYDIPFERLTTSISRLIVSGSNRLFGGSGSLYGPNMALRTSVAKQLVKLSCSSGRINEDLDLTIHLRRMDYRIRHCEQMQAAISGRRLASWPVNFWRYCRQWPRTYAVHGDKLAARLTYLFMVFGCLGQMLIVLPLRAYDPARRRLSLRCLINHQEDRTIP